MLKHDDFGIPATTLHKELFDSLALENLNYIQDSSYITNAMEQIRENYNGTPLDLPPMAFGKEKLDLALD
jgi:hypothetical protein